MFLIAKYRCDVGRQAVATRLRASLPGVAGHFSIRAGSMIDHCSRGNPAVSSIIDVSPLERDLQAAVLSAGAGSNAI